jgi:hypothetical protein
VILGALIAAAAVIALRRGAHPLERRLLGAWELMSTPSGTSAERIIEFRDDGRFWVYPKGKRHVITDVCEWQISEGALVTVLDNPLGAQRGSASAGKQLREIVRRIIDPRNVARSYRYSVRDDGEDTITITLAAERGNLPAKPEWATLKRAAEQPSP